MGRGQTKKYIKICGQSINIFFLRPNGAKHLDGIVRGQIKNILKYLVKV